MLEIWCVGEVGYHATLSRWSSWVRIPYAPPMVINIKPLKVVWVTLSRGFRNKWVDSHSGGSNPSMTAMDLCAQLACGIWVVAPQKRGFESL